MIESESGFTRSALNVLLSRFKPQAQTHEAHTRFTSCISHCTDVWNIAWWNVFSRSKLLGNKWKKDLSPLRFNSVGCDWTVPTMQLLRFCDALEKNCWLIYNLSTTLVGGQMLEDQQRSTLVIGGIFTNFASNLAGLLQRIQRSTAWNVLQLFWYRVSDKLCEARGRGHMTPSQDLMGKQM